MNGKEKYSHLQVKMTWRLKVNNNIVLSTNRPVKKDNDNYLRNNDSGSADGADADCFDCSAQNLSQTCC